MIVKHNRLVSFDHSKKTTKRYRLIVNARERSIIDSFVDSIKYSDRRISTIIDVTKIIFSNVDSNSFHFDWQSVFTMIRLSHQIRSRSSEKHHIKIIRQWSNQNLRRWIRNQIFDRQYSKHFSHSRIFRYSFYLSKKSIILFYLESKLNINQKVSKMCWISRQKLDTEIIYLWWELCEIIFLYLAKGFIFSISMMNSIIAFQNFTSRITISKI